MVYEALSNKHFAFCSKAVNRNPSYNTRGILKRSSHQQKVEIGLIKAPTRVDTRFQLGCLSCWRMPNQLADELRALCNWSFSNNPRIMHFEALLAWSYRHVMDESHDNEDAGSRVGAALITFIKVIHIEVAVPISEGCPFSTHHWRGIIPIEYHKLIFWPFDINADLTPSMMFLFGNQLPKEFLNSV